MSGTISSNNVVNVEYGPIYGNLANKDAIAAYPSNGYPGSFIKINSNKSSPSIGLLMHEIGHTLGFAHTTSGGADNSDGAGTHHEISTSWKCRNLYYPLSIMYSNVGTNSFSSCDKTAIGKIY